MSELDVQPRVNSETISSAFEQELRNDDFPLADKGFSQPVTGASKRTGSAKSGRQRPPKLRQPRAGYSDDPLMAADEDPEDSCPPKEDIGNRKKAKATDPKDSALNSHRRTLSGKREENGFSTGKKLSDSAVKPASKIPRVAQLGSSKSARSSTGATPDKSPASPTPSLGSKSSVTSKFGGPKKPTGSPTPAKNDTTKSSMPWKSKTQSDKLKAAIGGKTSTEAKRDEKPASRIPSRPGSAASVNSARTTASQRPTARKPTTSQGGLSARGTANGGGYAAATAASKRRSATGSPVNRRMSKTGTESAAAPAELLTAISGPDEELTELSRSIEEGNTEGQTANSSRDLTTQELAPGAQSDINSEELVEPTKLCEEAGAESTASKPEDSTVSSTAAPVYVSANFKDQPEGVQQDQILEESQVAEPAITQKSAVALTKSSEPKAKKSKAAPRPEWVDIAPPPQEEEMGDAGGTAEKEHDAGPTENKQFSSKKTPKIPETPFSAEAEAQELAVDDDKPLEEDRPGVGRKKAADLPHDGYSKPSNDQKGCCGCVVM